MFKNIIKEMIKNQIYIFILKHKKKKNQLVEQNLTMLQQVQSRI